MSKFFRSIAGLIIAALVTSIIGSLFSTQSVIASLQSLDVEVPLTTRLSMTVNDLGILLALMPITAICFILGFLVAAIGLRFIGGNRIAWHIVAGASALICTLIVMKTVLLVTPIAGTRTLLGLASFGLAGAIGGWVYAKITNSAETAS